MSEHWSSPETIGTPPTSDHLHRGGMSKLTMGWSTNNRLTWNLRIWLASPTVGANLRVWMVRVHKLWGALSVSSPWIQYWVTPRIEVGAFTNTGIGCCLHFLCRGWSLVSWTLCSLQLVEYEFCQQQEASPFMVVQSPFVSCRTRASKRWSPTGHPITRSESPRFYGREKVLLPDTKLHRSHHLCAGAYGSSKKKVVVPDIVMMSTT